jgi:hypothetical protein
MCLAFNTNSINGRKIQDLFNLIARLNQISDACNVLLREINNEIQKAKQLKEEGEQSFFKGVIFTGLVTVLTGGLAAVVCAGVTLNQLDDLGDLEILIQKLI